jgi:hypothetical protein
LADEFVAGEGPSLGKLKIPFTLELHAPKIRYDPLADVSA